MVKRLQVIYQEKILLISCGAFYIALAENAVILNEELGLKTICAQKEICKVGIPINSINKYIEKLDKTGYSYIILDYDKEKSKIIKKFEQYGEREKYFKFNTGCYKCENIRHFKKTEYEKALDEYIKEEFGEIYL